jgi:ABC-type sugar transport system permease subunit
MISTRAFLRAVSRNKIAYLFCLPAVVFFTLFKIYPILQSFALSFHQYQFGPGPYVGLENYAQVLEDSAFWQALTNTTIVVILVTSIGTITGYVLALMLSEEFRGCKFYRTLIFLPVVTSVTVISLVWKVLYNPAPFGFFNSILGYFRIPPQGWLSDPKQALYALTIPLIRQYLDTTW